MPDPRVPGSSTDRTGSAGLLRRALREISRRWAGLQSDVLALLDGIGRLQTNAAADGLTIYTMTPAQMAQLSLDLQAAVRRWIADDRQPANQLWWDPYSADAAAMGAAQSAANLAGLSQAYAAARSVESIIYSEPYRNRIAMAQIRSMDHWTSTAAAVRADLAQIIGRGVADGRNPRVVAADIVTSLGMSKSRAQLYAQTDITGTLRETRWQEADYAEQQFSMRIGMLWTSALIPSTRPWHASRNGSTYSTGEVRVFYGQRGNVFRCHCSQTEALLDSDGVPILTDRLKSAMRKEREKWRADHDGA